MPYITKERRVELMKLGARPETAGELNYCLTMVCLSYLSQPMGGMTIRYRILNEVIGALECAKLEFTRRMVAPHEEQAIRRNGDVYQRRKNEQV